jgi:two-component system, NarL family, nitrate/nitrite response regulator NarL
MASIRALLVDDHALFRESVARALDSEPDFVVSHCATIRDALEVLQREAIDVVLLDHDLGAERASQFLPSARQLGFSGRVLIVTAWVSDTEARRLLRQGVAGIFVKESPLSMLAESIRTIQSGEIWLDKRYRNLAGEEKATNPADSGPRFNERQRKVLRFVLEGLSNKEIAWHLQISESYVKAILQNLFEKTGVRTRGQLVRVALEHYDDQL